MAKGLDSLRDKVVDLLVDTICVVDAEGRYVFVSAACEQLLGYKPAELLGRNMIELVHPDDRERTLAAAENVMRGRPHSHFENRYVRKDGSIVEIMWSARWLAGDEMRLAVARDVTELKRSARQKETMYRISETAHSAEGLPGFFKRVHEFVGDLFAADRFFVALYDESEKMLSFPYFYDGEELSVEPIPLQEESLIARIIRDGKPLLANSRNSVCSITEPDTGREDDDWLGAPLITRSGASPSGAIVVQIRSGAFGYSGQECDLMRFVATQVASVLERKHQEEQLHHMAHHDPLTNLPNRSFFHDRMQIALDRARHEGGELALLYLDLHDFKMINDSLGHAAGDQVLRIVSRRLEESSRETDLVSRIGGDEFTVLVNGVHGSEDVDTIIKRFREALAMPLELDGRTFSVAVDIGVAFCPADGEDIDTLLQCADEDMYRSKRNQMMDNCSSGANDRGKVLKMPPRK